MAIIWNKDSNHSIEILPDGGPRTIAIKIASSEEKNIILVNTYMPSFGSTDHIDLYKDMLSEIHEIAVKYNADNLLWAGDLNASLQRTPPNKQDQLLRTFISQSSLVPAGTHNTPTFYHHNGKSNSQIDHLMISQDLMPRVNGFQVCTREFQNTSTHDPVLLSLDIELCAKPILKPQKAQAPKVKWSKTDLEQYLDITHNRLQGFLSNSSDCSTELQFQYLQTILLEASEQVAPVRKKRTFKRNIPWTPRMTALCKKQKELFWKWKTCGKLKEDSETFREMKAAKRQFRQAQRQAHAAKRQSDQE